jgi:hypothetical protein
MLPLLFTDKVFFATNCSNEKPLVQVVSNITILCRGVHPSLFHHRMSKDEAS